MNDEHEQFITNSASLGDLNSELADEQTTVPIVQQVAL